MITEPAIDLHGNVWLNVGNIDGRPKLFTKRGSYSALLSTHSGKFWAEVWAAGKETYCEDFDTLDEAAEAAERAMTASPREAAR